MTGRWADGIQPRRFRWLQAERLAISERPGGTGGSYRRVRRQEELIWLVNNHFDFVVTLADAPVNLHSYEGVDIGYAHLPWPSDGPTPDYLRDVHRTVTGAVRDGKRVLLHKDDIDDHLASAVAAMLLLAGRAKNGPQATALTERLLGQRLGPAGQVVVEMALGMVQPPDDG